MPNRTHSDRHVPTEPSNLDQTQREARLRRWLSAFSPIRELGRFHNAPAHLADWRDAARPVTPKPQTAESLADTSLTAFLAQTRLLLAISDDEQARRRLEDELLTLAEPLHAAGLFQLLRLKHAGLQAMIDDHLTNLDTALARCCTE